MQKVSWLRCVARVLCDLSSFHVRFDDKIGNTRRAERRLYSFPGELRHNLVKSQTPYAPEEVLIFSVIFGALAELRNALFLTYVNAVVFDDDHFHFVLTERFSHTHTHTHTH